MIENDDQPPWIEGEPAKQEITGTGVGSAADR